MFRLIEKKSSGGIKVINASSDKNDMIDNLLTKVSNNFLKRGKYCSTVLGESIESFETRVSALMYYLDSVDQVVFMVEEFKELTDRDIVAAGGGVCKCCGSDNTEASMPKMNEGFITRNITCNVCFNDTDEYYPLAGINT